MATLAAVAASYQPKDDFFGPAFIDVDEEREAPIPHRYVHGGFEETATRFSFYFPPECGARFFHFLEGAYGGSEHATSMPIGAAAEGHLGALGFAASRGAFLVESNQGHIGAEVCAKAGSEATVYSFRASAESARFARVVAAAVYDREPQHGYVYGGSGGGARTKLCVEYVGDGVWDAGIASVAGGATTMRNFSVMNNAKRLLHGRTPQIADATDVGGSGDPFEGLNTQQREVLADLYAAGFSRGAERSLADALDLGFMLWAWQADHLIAAHPEYFEAFWSEPGHAGADGDLDATRIQLKTTVAGTITPPEVGQYEVGGLGNMLTFMFSDDKQVGLLLAEDAPPMVEGSRVTITSGDAAGRQLYCIAAGGPVLLGASLGEAQELLFDGVRPGDEVVVDNRDYLAFCHYYRHHVADPREIPRFAVDDNYLYPTYHFDDTKAYGAPMAGMAHDGNIKVPLFLIQHSRDTSCWLIDGVRYDEVVRSQVGDRVSEMWRFWVMDNAEHMPGSAIAPTPPPVPTSRLVEGWSAMETGVDLMVAWIERNEQPPEDTEYTFDRCHNHVSLAPTAAERRGIQPVVTATANGGVRADVKAGDEVQLAATSEVPRGVGGIVELAWDFEGTGEWSAVPLGGGLTSSVSEQAAHRYEAPGVYFPSFRVVSHLQGDRADPYGRIMNVGRCRVVAT